MCLLAHYSIDTLFVSLPPMKHSLYILLLLIISASALHAQRRPGGDRKGFSLGNLSKANQEVPDSLLVPDSAAISPTARWWNPNRWQSATWPIRDHRHKPVSSPNARNHGISCLPMLTIIISQTPGTHCITTRKFLIRT